MTSFKPESIHFDQSKGTILLSVFFSDIHISDTLREYAQAHGLMQKDEFHITIFGFDAGKKILDRIDRQYPNEKESILQNIQSIVYDTDWAFAIREEAYRISKTYSRTPDKGGEEKRESIIAMADVPGAKEFFDRVSAVLSFRCEAPPLHVTLFSKSTDQANMLAGIGISSADDLRKRQPVPIRLTESSNEAVSIRVIYIPTRPQTDTCIAILLLRHYGKDLFQGIEGASLEVVPQLPAGETELSLRDKGVLLLDVGGGVFDHHAKPFQATVSHLVARMLGIEDNQAIAKLLQLAERDDFYGKGTLSEDPLDRAFGLPSLITVLNKKYVKDAAKVVDSILPVLEAFLAEEEQRTIELPREFNEKMAQGKVHAFSVRQGRESFNGIYIESDNVSMAGFLRARAGGNFDIVATKLSSGHVNILTRQATRADLRSLIVLLRMQEAEAKGVHLDVEAKELAVSGMYPSIPEWYYDTATNSLFNGGPNPTIPPTKIDPLELLKLLEIGLSQALWVPPQA